MRQRALVRRRGFIAVALGGAYQACAPNLHQPPQPYPAVGNDPSLDSVLIMMPDSAETRIAHQALVDELSQNFNVHTTITGLRVTPEEIGVGIASCKARGVLLMNNSTVRAFQGYRQQVSAAPPAVVMMSSFLTSDSVQRVWGVAYEIPAVTQFSQLQALLATDIRTIGVLHRSELRAYVERESLLALEEGYQIKAIELADGFSASEVAGALARLRWDLGVDALWVLNDNALLHPRLLSEAWLPNLRRGRPLPVIVGVMGLVHPDLEFGSFAMLPDHAGTGVQAANVVFELAAQNWQLDEPRIELPVAVETVVNARLVRRYFALRPRALFEVDRVVE